MNLQDCEEYLTTLNFGITAEDISEYNETFTNYCAMFRETGDIIAKDEYTDKELYNYTIKVMKHMMECGSDLLPKLLYMMEEGFILMNKDGTIFKNYLEFEELTEEDFCGIEE
jgi:hypothetical protein